MHAPVNMILGRANLKPELTIGLWERGYYEFTEAPWESSIFE